MKMFRTLLVGLPLFAFSCATPEQSVQEKALTPPAAPAAKVLPTTLPEALTSEFRSTENQARDVYRHPLETLQFFGLEGNMSVVEISPGGGWYSEILAPFLTAHGEFTAAVPVGKSEESKEALTKYQAWLQSHPELKGSVVPFGPAGALVLKEPVDMIVTFRNVHNWMNGGNAEAAFRSFYANLKPGGILGVEEHRGNSKKQDPKAKSGYVKESEVIRFATKAGFKLDSKSEINANPKDTKDYKDGVWTLPPVLKNGEVDKQKYLDIGESDRMTLKFVKPSK